jgi:glycosyltransferase involved in cell wall biosynthesis
MTILTNENINLTNEKASQIDETRTLQTRHNEVLQNVCNIDEHTKNVFFRLNGRKLRRWLRVFDLCVLIKHSSFAGKLKIAVKIALRCLGIKKYKIHFLPTAPTEYINSNLLAIFDNIEAVQKENAPGVVNFDNAALDTEAAKQDFIQYKKERNGKYFIHASNIGVPCIKRLVSIVLPVYNGGDFLAESIESVLAQSYTDFELIIVNDGSTDKTPQVIKQFASEDSRIRVVNQENQKLPRALSNGFNIACGEYYTWTSADNIMNCDFVEKLVNELENDTQIDMIYASMNYIDENGDFIADLSWHPYRHPEIPHAVLYPRSQTALNSSVCNTIGAAFMYRASAAHAIGEYSDNRYTVEDLDYWLRMNEIFELRHASFEEPIYNYRLHSETLTAQKEELRIAEKARDLVNWDIFRRDFLLCPLKWRLQGFEASNPLHIQFLNALVSARHSLVESEDDLDTRCSRDDAWIVYFDMSGSEKIPATQNNCYTACMHTNSSKQINLDWHCMISEKPVTSRADLGAFKGWYSFKDGRDMFSFLDIRAKSYFLHEMETQ